MNKILKNNEQRNEEDIMGNNLIEQENEFNTLEELININKKKIKDLQKINPADEEENKFMLNWLAQHQQPYKDHKIELNNDDNNIKQLPHKNKFHVNLLNQHQDPTKDNQTELKNDECSENNKIEDTHQDNDVFASPVADDDFVKRRQTRQIQESIKDFRNFFVTLAKESPKFESSDFNENSDSETYGGSYHCRETDVCRDSTDTESNSSFTTTGIATIDVMEYDLASSSSSDFLYTDEDSSGTDDFVLKSAVLTKAFSDGVLNQSSFWSSDFADTEELSSSEFDYELSKDDYWTCVKCKNTSNNPKCRYCEKCYQIRKTHFPPRPRNYRSRQRNQKLKFKEYSTKFDPNDNNSKLEAGFSLISNERLNERLTLSLESKSGKNNCLNSAGSSDESDICSNSNKNQSKIPKNIRKRKSSPYKINSNIKKPCYDLETDLYKKLNKDSGISSAPSSQDIGISSTATGSADEIKSENSSKTLCASSDDDTSCEDFIDTDLIEIQANLLEDFCDNHNSEKTSTIKNNGNDSSKNVLKRSSSAMSLRQDDSNCVICFSSAKNGVFVHSKYCCVCCCYNCAKQIWNKMGRCPICKGAVRNIMKLFIH